MMVFKQGWGANSYSAPSAGKEPDQPQHPPPNLPPLVNNNQSLPLGAGNLPPRPVPVNANPLDTLQVPSQFPDRHGSYLPEGLPPCSPSHPSSGTYQQKSLRKRRNVQLYLRTKSAPLHNVLKISR